MTPGQSAVFVVGADGIPKPRCQWQGRANPATSWMTLNDGAGYSGSDTATLIVSATTPAMDGAEYRCLLSNANGQVLSPTAVLTVLPSGITTLAGSPGVQGYADGIGKMARFNSPKGLAVDAAGNVYVADSANCVIRRITLAGAVSTVAGLAGTYGQADGPAGAARFTGPSGIAVDPAGNLYVADTGNHTIRKITPGGEVSTLAGSPGVQGGTDGLGAQALFAFPNAVAADGAGYLYVTDTANHTIRKITPGER